MDDLEQHESAFSELLSQVPFDDQARAEHRDALRLRALAALDAAHLPAPAPAWKQILNQGRELMRRPVPRFIAAAVMCLAAVAVWSLFPDRHSTAHAFDKFAKAIVDAESATFQLEVNIEGHEKQEGQGYYQAPGKMREDMKMFCFVIDMKAGKVVLLNPEQKLAFVGNMKNRPTEPGKRQFDDVFQQMRDLLSEGRNANEEDLKQLGEKEMDGRRVVGFSYANAARSLTLWGDPATGLPVLVESVSSGTPKGGVTMSHFEFNEKLDPALFDTTPPAGYKVQSFDVDGSKPTEADQIEKLIKTLRQSADLDDGQFIPSLDSASMQALLMKQSQKIVSDRKDKSKFEMSPEEMKLVMTTIEGMTFALGLPESADAHYAGKGVKRGESDRPIFWYKPEGAKTYHVIYADLTVKDAETAPEVVGAVRLEKTKPPEKQDVSEKQVAPTPPKKQDE